jgi:hypothetical protein
MLGVFSWPLSLRLFGISRLAHDRVLLLRSSRPYHDVKLLDPPIEAGFFYLKSGHLARPCKSLLTLNNSLLSLLLRR